MEIYTYLVDWQEVIKSYNKGTIDEDIFAALDIESDWLSSYEEIDESHNLYCIVADAYQQLREGLSLSVRKIADDLINPLITFDGYCQDIDLSNSGCLAQAISPDSVVKFVDYSEKINFESWRNSYYNYCSEKIQNSLANYCNSEQAELSFEEGFLPYIQKWLKVLKKAKDNQKGILISWS